VEDRLYKIVQAGETICPLMTAASRLKHGVEAALSWQASCTHYEYTQPALEGI
jgi:hypothetical protein